MGIAILAIGIAMLVGAGIAEGTAMVGTVMAGTVMVGTVMVGTAPPSTSA
jgi:hypothetical protein